MRISSICVEAGTAPTSEAEGIRRASITRSPSLSFGMNSPPRFIATGTLTPTNARASKVTTPGRRITASSIGAYSRLASRIRKTTYSIN